MELWNQSSTKKAAEPKMADLLYLALIAGFFGLSVWLVKAVDRP
jgi:hypothetical protein